MVTLFLTEAQAQTAEDLLNWTFGPLHRAVDVRQLVDDPLRQKSLGRQALWVPSPGARKPGALRRPLLPRCYEVDGILPLPANLFLLSGGGGLYLFEEGKQTIEPLPLPEVWFSGKEKIWLLAFESPKAPKGTPVSLNILVVQGPEKNRQVLRLTLQGRRITTVGLLKELPSSRKAYFSQYQVPHCQSQGTRCLEPSKVTTAGGQHELGVRIHQPDGNSYVDPYIQSETAAIVDAVWSMDGHRILMLQEHCPSTSGGQKQ